MQCSTYANEVSFALHLEENGYECKCLYGVTVTVRRDKEQSGNDEVPLIVSPIYLVMYFLAFFFRLLFLYVVCLAVYESFVLYRGGTKESWASIKILTSPADSVSRLFESTLGLWRLRCPFIYYVLWREREDYSIKSVIKPREMGGGGKFNLIADHWKLVSRKRAAFFLVVALYIYEMNIVSTLINAHSFEFNSGKLRCFDSSRVTSKKYHKWTQKRCYAPTIGALPSAVISMEQNISRP